MMSDSFKLETPVAKKRESISGRDDSQARWSNGSFTTLSLNHENFGDWGSLNNSKNLPLPFSIDEGETDDPFSEQKEGKNMDGFDLTERKDVPKLPISRREIRKVNLYEQNQPTITIQTGSGHLNDSDFSLSTIGFESPGKNSSNKFRLEPSKSIQRSVSDVGGIGKKKTSKAEESIPPIPGFRNLWKAQKGNDMSLSFGHRRQPFSKRPLLTQIGERRQSYQQMDQEEGVEDEPQPQKRSSSKDRLKKKGAVRTNSTGMRSEDAALDEYDQRRPTRKSSYGSRSSASSGRRTTTNSSLSDSNRSINRNSRRKNDATDNNNDTTIPLASDLERESRSSRRLSEKGHRVRSRSQNNIKPKKSTGRETNGSSEEANKHSSKCNTRRTVGRRASMTGGIVYTEPEKQKSRRRSSMDHVKTGGIVCTEPDKPKSTRRSSMEHVKKESPVGRPKDRRRRRSSMDHHTASFPLLNYSPIEGPKTKSIRSIALSSHVGDEGNPFPSHTPFGEEGTETTKEISEGSLSFRNSKHDQARPLSTKFSMASRAPPRKASSNPNITKVSSHSSRRTSRTKSDLGKQRQRHQKEDKDKSVSVGEILALLASTPDREDISGKGAPQPLPKTTRSRSSDPKERNSRSSTGTPRSFRDRSRSKSRNRSSLVEGSPQQHHRSSSLYKIRKGKRVGHQPEESSPHEESSTKKEKPVGLGKGSRSSYRNRRASAI